MPQSIRPPARLSPNPGTYPSLVCSVQDWSLQCPSNATLAVQNIYNTPLKTTPSERNLKLQNEDVTWSPLYNLSATRTNERWALSLQEVELDAWFLISSHCTGNMYSCNSCTSLVWVLYFIYIYSWIDVFDLNQLFNWRAEIWEPFKMKLIWGLQAWTLLVCFIGRHFVHVGANSLHIA